jgi:hypothetical protein
MSSCPVSSDVAAKIVAALLRAPAAILIWKVLLWRPSRHPPIAELRADQELAGFGFFFERFEDCAGRNKAVSPIFLDCKFQRAPTLILLADRPVAVVKKPPQGGIRKKLNRGAGGHWGGSKAANQLGAKFLLEMSGCQLNNF